MPSRSLVWDLMFRAKASRRCLGIPQPERPLGIDCFFYNPYPYNQRDQNDPEIFPMIWMT
ncbi:hypothetical protein SCT19_04240 [Legionella pneumophila serogroup 1]